jgi:hypothetical protein
MADASLYNPSPVQQEFHLCPADEILFAGSAGPGKSLALLMDPIQTQLVYEHERWQRQEIHQSLGWAIHFRREFPMLEQTLDRARRIFPKLDPGVKWNGDTHMFTFSCGYKIQFAHMKNEGDWMNYDSSEYSGLYFDELTQFTEEQYKRLVSRVRSSDPVLQKRKRIVSATNPDANWVRDYFVEPCPTGRKLLVTNIRMADGSNERRTRIFIPANLWDNPDESFRRDYERTLQDMPDHIRKARLYGDWWVVQGAFYSAEWEPSVHICKPFRIPDGWRRFRSGDWGYRSPGCIHWWAVDTDGNLVCYRELTFQGKYVDDVAKMVREIEIADGTWDEKKDCSRLTGPMDTQIWEQRGQRTASMAEIFAGFGVWWEKCEKNKSASVVQFVRRLRMRSKVTEDGPEVPGVRFFSTCKQAIKTIPGLSTDTSNAELPADGGPDHWHDSVMYACAYRTIPSDSDTVSITQKYDDELADLRRRKRAGAYGYGGF